MRPGLRLGRPRGRKQEPLRRRGGVIRLRQRAHAHLGALSLEALHLLFLPRAPLGSFLGVLLQAGNEAKREMKPNTRGVLNGKGTGTRQPCLLPHLFYFVQELHLWKRQEGIEEGQNQMAATDGSELGWYT